MTHYTPPGGIDPERMRTARGGALRADDTPDTEEIRVEIEQTRTEMSGTIDAIQRKLAPETLTEQAKDVAATAAEQAKEKAQEVLEQAVREVKDAALEVTHNAVQEVKEAAREVTHDAKEAAWDATVGRAEEAVTSASETAKGLGATVIDTIKANPIPAALAGISLAWLYMKRSNGQSRRTYRASYPVQQAYPVRSTYEASWSDARGTGGPGATAYDARRTSGAEGQGVLGSVTEKVSGAASTAGEVASDVASSAGQMAGSAASAVGGAASSAGETALDAGSGIVDLVQRNPIPAALVGLGLGWLYMNRSTGEPDYNAHSGDHYRYPDAMRHAGGTSGGVGTSSYGSSSGSTGGVTDMARRAGETAGELAGGVTEQAGELAGTVVEKTRRAPGQVQRLVEENPIVAAALAASVGAAVGLALPTTETEDRMLGSTRDRVMGKAQQATSEAMDKVQTVASEAMSSVQDAAQDVQKTVTREARSQGLTV